MSTKKLQIIDSIVSTDSTLMISGKAADAKATGDKFTSIESRIGDAPVAIQISSAMDNCITGMDVSGTTITYIKGDGSTGTITTQDTNTTYNIMEGATSTSAGTAGLVPAPDAGANLKYLRGDGTWQDLSAITNDEIDEICGVTIYDSSEVQV